MQLQQKQQDHHQHHQPQPPRTPKNAPISSSQSHGSGLRGGNAAPTTPTVQLQAQVPTTTVTVRLRVHHEQHTPIGGSSGTELIIC